MADEGARPAVVFVSVSLGIGGPARSLLTILRHVDGDLERILYAPHGDLARAVAHEGTAEHHLVMPFDRRSRRRSRVRAAIELARYVRRHRRRITAIHANGEGELNIALLAALVTRVRVVMVARTSQSSPTAGWFAALWRLRRPRVRWLAVSTTAREVLADTIGLDPTVIEIVHNGIDPEEVVAEPLPHEGIRVGFLGLAAPHKGFDLLPAIVRGVDRPDVAFDLFVAPPPPDLPLHLRPPWDQLAENASRSEVFLVGRVHDVSRAYAECDVVLCPSRRESLPRVAAEAMANGLPVVASDIPGYREVLGDEAALYFSPDDPAGAAAAIRRLADDPDLRRRMGAAGRLRAERFRPDRVVPTLVAHYLGLAGDDASGSAHPPKSSTDEA